MFPSDPRAAIARMPYLLDLEPHETLMVAGFDAEGVLRHRANFRIDGYRPLDEPLLESSLWLNDIVYAAAVSYSAVPQVDLRPLVDAWRYRGRTALAAAWGGSATWRSYLCDAEHCCTEATHAYASQPALHDRFDPLQDRSEPMLHWRRARWQEWQQAVTQAAEGSVSEAELLESLSRTLHDIPIRDAVLAFSADPDVTVQLGVRRLLHAMSKRSTLGSAVPTHTCLAALHYLGNELQEAKQLVADVLDVEEYSLARLLHNGLEMRAPASLLARSFAHFSPLELLAA